MRGLRGTHLKRSNVRHDAMVSRKGVVLYGVKPLEHLAMADKLMPQAHNEG